MNNATQIRQGSSFRVSYPDFPSFSLIPHHFRLHQEMGKQDVMVLTYSQFSPFYMKALKTGVPIKVSWTNGAISDTFFGYVYDVQPTIQQTLQRNVVIRAVGAAFSLKEGGAKIWTNKTAPEIVTDIAKKFKLKPVVTAHSLRFSQQSLIGHTYWQKIQELARRVGYVAQVYGTELHFHPMDTMIDKFSTSIPVLSFHEPFNNSWGAVESQTLDMFKPVVGDYTESEGFTRRSKSISGVDPATGNMYTVSASPSTVGKNTREVIKDPLFQEALPDAITGSQGTAQAIVDAHAQLSRFSIKALGGSQGDPRIAPYRTIEINGTGDTTDGFWVVSKAVHFVAVDGRYQVEFSCVSDGTGGNKPSAFRSSKAGIIPTRNVVHELTSGTGVPTVSSLHSATAMIKAVDSGFKVTPRRWVGR